MSPLLDPTRATQPVARSTGPEGGGLASILPLLQMLFSGQSGMQGGTATATPPAGNGAPPAAPGGLGGMAGLGASPLQMFLRQMLQQQPGGTGTPNQQAQGGSGPLGAASGGLGAMFGPFFGDAGANNTPGAQPFFNTTAPANTPAAPAPVAPGTPGITAPGGPPWQMGGDAYAGKPGGLWTGPQPGVGIPVAGGLN